jgi:DNA-binding CsgD family transcriptional regulator
VDEPALRSDCGARTDDRISDFREEADARDLTPRHARFMPLTRFHWRKEPGMLFEQHRDAGLALAASGDPPIERVRALLVLAEVRISQHDPAAAAELIGHATRLLMPFGAAALADRIATLPAAGRSSADLTRREIEVLCLLARRYTNAEIADALFVSPHTATTHVKHVLAKLGATNRREAAAIAARHGLA